jgi:hypothetical protein
MKKTGREKSRDTVPLTYHDTAECWNGVAAYEPIAEELPASFSAGS